jgi:hypothetical protein
MALSGSERRIAATFLSLCSPEKAYDWLVTNKASHTDLQNSISSRYEIIEERKSLEYILLRRKNQLIDLGLAQFGCVPATLKKVFYRGTSGIRCAVLSNFFLIDQALLGDAPSIDIERVIAEGKKYELQALAQNPYLPDDYYINLLNRTGYFSKVSDSNYQFLLMYFSDSPRLATKYDNLSLDGYADYKYNKVFTEAWRLTITAPNTQEWASLLYRLLSKAILPVGFNEKQEAIERWRIDNPKTEDEKYYYSGPSHHLRSRLADLLEADEKLMTSTDLALRRSFYRRFEPLRFPDWNNFLEKDGEDFVQEALENINLWQDSGERERLHQAAWDCPDPRSDMDMPNMYRFREKKYREQHPEWFQEEDDEYSSGVGATVRRIEVRLRIIDEKLENLSSPGEPPPKKWWG